MAVQLKTPQAQQPPDLNAYFRAASEADKRLLDQKMAQRSTSPLTNQQTAAGSATLSPLTGKYPVTQQFGNYNPQLYSGITPDSRHLGLDVGTPTGTAVQSPFAGIVKTGKSKDFGTYVQVVANNGSIMQFSHLNDINDLISQLGAAGRTIQAGQLLGHTGATGNSTGPHLDIMYQQGGKWVNPLNYAPLKAQLGA